MRHDSRLLKQSVDGKFRVVLSNYPPSFYCMFHTVGTIIEPPLVAFWPTAHVELVVEPINDRDLTGCSA